MSSAPPPAALPAGGKDVLAVEAQELRAIEGALRGRFGAFGYREVMTPVLEFAEVIDRAQEGGLREAFRLFDDAGRVLVLRPDLTIPVARLVATRMADHPGPVRVSYLARAFRPPPAGRPRPSEERQAGVELVGADGPGADAEALALLVESLRAAGLAASAWGWGTCPSRPRSWTAWASRPERAPRWAPRSPRATSSSGGGCARGRPGGAGGRARARAPRPAGRGRAAGADRRGRARGGAGPAGA